MRPLSAVRGLTVPGRPREAAAARDFVYEVLGDDHPFGTDTALVVDELVSNAIRHSASGQGGHVSIYLIAASAGSVRIEVVDDGGPTVPELQTRNGHLLRESGRGLYLVDQLTGHRWGYHRDEAGVTTWAEIGEAADG